MNPTELLLALIVVLILVIAGITWDKMRNTEWMAKVDDSSNDPNRATSAILVRKSNGIVWCLSYDGVECMRFPTLKLAREFIPDESKIKPVILS
ncbi:hypothetical protein F-liban_316 [Faustovirus]|nr:hypothetical protein F-liban_316 [Faustovirus]SME65004.1 Hypothetical protein FSTVST1_307 [Faustovirus ST1]